MTYTPVVRGSFTWRVVETTMRLLFRRSVVTRDTQRRPREEIIIGVINDSVGAAPDMDTRKDQLNFVASGGVIAGLVMGAIGFAVGAVLWVTIGRAVGSAVMRAFWVLGTAPLIALGGVWSVRAFLNEIDYRRWVKQGCPAGHVPSGRSQPKDRDLFVVVPLALLFAAFLWAM